MSGEDGESEAGAKSDPAVRAALLHSLRTPALEPLAPLTDEELGRSITGEVADAIAAQAAGGEVQTSRPVILGFKIGEQIGQGGQGSVFDAIQESTGQRVAIKVIAGGALISTDARKRLEREVQALSQISHPNVAQIVDYGRTAESGWFVATRFIEGKTLDEHLRGIRDSKDPRRVLALMGRIIGAVEAIHAAGVVHRDIKPANVLMDRSGEPRVVDFGLSRPIEADDQPALTRTVQVMGSLPWMSPEQVRGEAAKVDGKSDVYVLGFLLFYALTGEFPYMGVGPMPEVMQAVLAADPEPAVRRLVRPKSVLAKGLQRVLLQAMEKSPGRRYASAAELKEDLDRLISAKPVLAKRRWSRWRLTRLAGQLVAAAIVVMALVLGVRALQEERVTPLVMRTEVNSVGIRMVKLLGGKFRMGSVPDEVGHQGDEPMHLASIDAPFWIGTTEVTRRQFASVMPEYGAVAEADGELPVVNVSWEEASEFCRRLSAREGKRYRLPSEAEWEFACRAGEMTAFAGTHELKSMGWSKENSGERVHAVGEKSPNAWGLFDFHGNVGEWCEDRYAIDYVQSLKDSEIRVFRGGSYAEEAVRCRSAARSMAVSQMKSPHIGFRLVRDDGESSTESAASEPAKRK